MTKAQLHPHVHLWHGRGFSGGGECTQRPQFHSSPVLWGLCYLCLENWVLPAFISLQGIRTRPCANLLFFKGSITFWVVGLHKSSSSKTLNYCISCSFSLAHLAAPDVALPGNFKDVCVNSCNTLGKSEHKNIELKYRPTFFYQGCIEPCPEPTTCSETWGI